MDCCTLSRAPVDAVPDRTAETVRIARCRPWDFDRVADRLARHDIERLSRSELVEVLRVNTTTRWKVPGSDLTDSLCHDVIHGLDLTEGLGRPSTATSQQLLTVLETIETKKPRTPLRRRYRPPHPGRERRGLHHRQRTGNGNVSDDTNIDSYRPNRVTRLTVCSRRYMMTARPRIDNSENTANDRACPRSNPSARRCCQPLPPDLDVSMSVTAIARVG